MLIRSAIANTAVVFVVGLALGVPVSLLIDEKPASLENGGVVGWITGGDQGDN